MDKKNHFRSILAKYLPEDSIELVIYWIFNYKINLKITKSRTTKLGDYYPPVNKRSHKISINQDLNKFAFLVTLIHEIAHLVNWEKHKNKVKPHGIEWKNEFRILMRNFIDINIFPPDVLEVINNYIKNPSASSCSDLNLTRTLRKYDINNNLIHLEDIPENTVFKIKNGRIFNKGEKLRKRYKCKDLYNEKIYLFNPLAEVKPVIN